MKQASGQHATEQSHSRKHARSTMLVMSQPQPPFPPYPPPQGQPPYGYVPQQGPEKFSPLDAIVPTNPLAAISCWTGILSLLVCGLGVVLGPIAVVTGLISRKKGAVIEESGYGKAASKARTWIGIITGTLGTIASIVFIVMMILNKR
jgi:hypothetical protein